MKEFTLAFKDFLGKKKNANELDFMEFEQLLMSLNIDPKLT
jgi:hypothetical protein